jgi:hypothetical protein
MKAIVVNKIKSPIRGRKSEAPKNEKLEKLEAEGVKLREKLTVNSKILENYKKHKKNMIGGMQQLKLEMNSIEEESINILKR